MRTKKIEPATGQATACREQPRIKPMTPTDPQHCRDLALEKRILASRMKDPLAKAMLIRLAKHYEELAKQPEGSISAMSEWLRLKPAFPDAQSLPATHNIALTSISVSSDSITNLPCHQRASMHAARIFD